MAQKRAESEMRNEGDADCEQMEIGDQLEIARTRSADDLQAVVRAQAVDINGRAWVDNAGSPITVQQLWAALGAPMRRNEDICQQIAHEDKSKVSQDVVGQMMHFFDAAIAGSKLVTDVVCRMPLPPMKVESTPADTSTSSGPSMDHRGLVH